MRRRRVRKPPMVVQLSLAAVQEEHGLYQLLAAESRWTRHQVCMVYAMFAFKSDEQAFVGSLLTQKQHYWVFRCNQQRFCGDFVVVDMSCPESKRRRIFVIEMKENTELKIDSGAGIQLRNAAEAIEIIAQETGAILADCPFETLVGDKQHLLAYLGAEDGTVPGASSCRE